MNYDLLSIILFYGIILFFFFRYRERFTIQSKIFVLLKTKLGLRAMEKLAKSMPRFWNILGYFSVLTGFAGMAFILFFLIKETFKFVTVPGAQPPLAPILPGVPIPGAPTLSFWHWIIAIFIVAVIHEFWHGIYARLYDIKVKSSGFAFMGPILAAFVEPDEKQMAKKPVRHQLAVLSAGAFSNILLGIFFLLLLNFVTGPMQLNMFEPGGIVVNKVLENYPAASAGIAAPFVIREINGKEINNFSDFVAFVNTVRPGQKVSIKTENEEFIVMSVAHPENISKGFIGVSEFEQKLKVKDSLEKYGKLPYAFLWINLLIIWLFIINIGVGLFNLLPLGPLDGGKMFYTAALAYTKDEKKAKQLWGFISFVCLVLIFISLAPLLWKFILFLGLFLEKIFILLLSL